MYILLTSKPPTKKLKAIEPDPDLTLVSSQHKCKKQPYVNLDLDIDVPANANSGSNTIITWKKADKGKVKAIDQLEGDLNGGPTTRVCYQLLTQSDN